MTALNATAREQIIGALFAALEMIEDLKARTKYWGTTRGEIARRLILEMLRQLEDQGRIQSPGPPPRS
jgi:hypothetical protein